MFNGNMRQLKKVTLRKERQSVKASPTSILSAVTAMIGLMIGVIAAFLFAANQAHSVAYFSEYGVTSALFETTWHTAIYSGSVRIMLVLFASVAGAILAIPLTLLLGLLFDHAGERLPHTRAMKWTSAVVGKLLPNKVSPETVILPFIQAVFALAIMAMYGVYILMMKNVELQAKGTAKQEMALISAADESKIAAFGLRKVNIQRLEGATPINDVGYMVACQVNTVCVIRQRDKTVVVPLKNLVRMETMQPLPPGAEKAAGE